MKTEEVISTLKLMQAQIEWDYPMEYAVAIDEAIKVLISPTQMSGTWISVDSDTKPENGDYVVVRYNCPVPPAVVEYRNEGFFDPYEGETVNAYGVNVVAWMPLPKEDKNDDGMETGINTAS